MAVTNFIPTIWSAALLSNLENTLVSEAFVNHDYDGDVVGAGSVKINTIGDVTVNDYTGTVTYQDLSTTAQTLNIDKKKYFAFQVDDVDKAQVASSGNLINTAMSKATYGILNVKDSDTFKIMATTGTALADTLNVYDADTAIDAILTIKEAMDTANIPSDGRVMAISPTFEKYLLSNKYLSLNRTVGETIIRNGYIGELFGIRLHRTNNLYTSGGLSYVVATTPMFTTEANQIEEIEARRLENSFKDGVRGLYVWGTKVTNAAGVIVAKVSFEQPTTPETPGGGT